MDVHNVAGDVTIEDLCLARARSADVAIAVHRRAHGLLADKVDRAQEGS